MECNQQACPAVCKQKRKIKEEENHQFDKQNQQQGKKLASTSWAKVKKSVPIRF